MLADAFFIPVFLASALRLAMEVPNSVNEGDYGSGSSFGAIAGILVAWVVYRLVTESKKRK